MRVIAITSTHQPAAVAEADHIVGSLTQVRVAIEARGISVALMLSPEP
jgi:hypothetical protein